MNLILITYLDRSGSTFLLNQLNKFCNVFVFPEAGYLSGLLLESPEKEFSLSPKLKRKLYYDAKTHFQLKKWPIKHSLKKTSEKSRNIDVFINLLKDYADLHKIKSDNFIFKQQFQNRLMDLSTFYPSGTLSFKHIVLIRDPRAILNSNLLAKKKCPQLFFNTNPLILSYNWNLLNKRIKELENNCSLISFEDLILRNKETLSTLFEHTGLESEKQKGENDYQERISPTEKKLHHLAFREIDKRRINAWENELQKEFISIIQEMTLKDTPETPYNKKAIEYSRIKKFYLTIYFKFRILFRVDKY